MAKFFGVIGYGTTEETALDVYDVTITEREYYGDVLRNTRRYESANQVNDNLNVSNTISIVADPFAIQNFHLIRYVTYMGAKWKVSNVEVQYPRLILTLGGVYNDDSGEEG